MNQGCVILASNTLWRVATLRDGSIVKKDVQCIDSSVQTIATDIRRAIEEIGGAGGAVLAIPSSWCLAASINTDGKARRTHLAKTYEIERVLPVAAEDIVADFVASIGEQELGVALQIHKLKPLLDALENEAVPVELISPTAMLAVDRWLASSNDPVDAVAWRNDGGIDLFLVSDKRLLGWKVLESVDSLERELRFYSLGLPNVPRIALIGFDEHEANSIDNAVREAADPNDTAVIAGCEALGGSLQPSINLRRDALANPEPLRNLGRPLWGAIAAVLLCLISVAAGQLLRANRYDRLTEENEFEQARLYGQTLPDRPTSVDPALMLEVEHRKLSGIRGQGTAIPVKASAILTLHAILTALPTELRFRVDELRLDGGQLQVEGQARSHSDAEAIAEAIRKGVRCDVDAPRSEQSSDKGVTFSLTGTVHTN